MLHRLPLSALRTRAFLIAISFAVATFALVPTIARAGCNLPPVGDLDCDGLGDAEDPCPNDTLNRCNGPVALCGSAPAGVQSCTAGEALRLDLGSSTATIDCTGATWNTDTGTGTSGSPGATVTIFDGPIVDAFGCSDPDTRAIVATERYAAQLVRSYPIANGQYIVNLLFAETFRGACTVGSRTIDIQVEGNLAYGGPAVGDGFDQYLTALVQNGFGSDCGGLVVRSAVVTVTDGSLDVTLTEDDPAAGDGNAALKGIEVLKLIDGCITDADCDDADACTDDVCTPEHTCDHLTGRLDADADAVCELFDPCPDDWTDDGDADGICAGDGFAAPAVGDGDNCPAVANADQRDSDGDGRGDACDQCPLDAGTAEDDCLGDGFWEFRAPGQIERGEAGVAAVGGKIYLIGGEQAAAGRSVEVYDIASDTWSFGPALPGIGAENLGRNHIQPVVVGSSIYVIGGLTTTYRDPLDEVIVLDTSDPGAGWQPRAPLPVARGSMGCAARNGLIYCAGGTGDTGADPEPATTDLRVYHTASDRWSPLAPMPHARDSAYAHVVGARLYLIGGRNGTTNSVVPFSDVYDIKSGIWSSAAPPPTARGGYASSVIEGRIVVFSGELAADAGGNPDGVLPAVHEYDPARDAWRSLLDIPTPRHAFMAVPVTGAGGRTLVHTISGGVTQGFSGSSAHEVFYYGNCANDLDCDDGNVCTTDSCEFGSCANLDNSLPCEDELFCNGADTCSGGDCSVHAGNPCDDGVSCTVDTCDDTIDQCANAPDDTPCDNGAFCDGPELCDPAIGCRPGAPPICDDGIACTVDSCSDTAGACLNARDDTVCDDGMTCNGLEICDSAAGCQAGTPSDCDDGIACTVDSCDVAADACVNTPFDGLCDDGNACTDQACEPSAGCTATPNSDPCDDGIACTTADACTAGTCRGTPDCANGECDVITGACVGTMVCIAAASHPGAVFAGAMTADTQYAGGPPADADDDADSLMPRLVYADSTVNAATGGSGDQVTYQFELPETAAWSLWGRLYYPSPVDGSQANSFLVSLDNGPRRIFGNRLDFQNWHWDGDDNLQSEPAAALDLGILTAGSHELVVEKREVNPIAPRLDVLCLVHEGAAAPTDAEALALLMPCDTDADCDDGNACTEDVCSGGACQRTATEGPCDDGLFCNGADQCSGGACSLHAGPPCDDGVSCTIDSCDEASDACTHAAADGRCTDGLYCNGVETCNLLTGCIDGPPPTCDDGEPCTLDACDDLAGCRHTDEPDGTSCNDGDVCNGDDTCQAGACTAGVPLACDDGAFCNGMEGCDPSSGCTAGSDPCNDAIACTIDSCDETADTCSTVPDDALCSDDAFCNGVETCDPASGCAAGTPPGVDDGIGCTVAACDEGADAIVHTPDDAGCDDGLFCNGVETCDPTAGCLTGEAPCQQADQCAAEACDETAARCDIVPVADGTACDDGDLCTIDDLCAAGTCTAGPPALADAGRLQIKRALGSANDRMALRASFPSSLLTHLPDQGGFNLVVLDADVSIVYAAIVPGDAFKASGDVYRYRDTGEVPEAPGLARLRIKIRTNNGRVRIKALVRDHDFSFAFPVGPLSATYTFGDGADGDCISAPDMTCAGFARVRCAVP